MTAAQFAFPNASRLSSSDDFLKIFSARRIRIHGIGFTILAHPGLEKIAKLGIALSKKKLPKAVQRNHVRRLVRESFRLHQVALSGFEVIVQVHRWDAVINHKDFFERLEFCWHKLQNDFNPALTP